MRLLGAGAGATPHGRASEVTSLKETPRSLIRYVVLLGVAAGVAAVGAVALLAWKGTGESAATFALRCLLFLGLFVVLERFGYVFTWRDHRLVGSFLEIGIFLAFLSIPGAALVILPALSSLAIHVWSRREPIKGVFNAAHYSLAGAGAWATFEGLQLAGASPVVAALVTPGIFNVLSEIQLAGVFALLERESVLRVFRERFAIRTLLSAAVGAGGGFVVHVLWAVHPVAILAVGPFVYLVQHYGVLSARVDRELGVHRHLAAAAGDLVGNPHIDEVANRVLEECHRLLHCARAVLTLRPAEEFPGGAWTREFGAGAGFRQDSISVELPGRGGTSIGSLLVTPRPASPAYNDLDRALLDVIAGQGATAIENARALGALDSAKRRLETFLETAEDAVLLVAEGGRVAYMNPAGNRLFRVPSEAVGSCNASDLLLDEDLILACAPQRAASGLIEGLARTRDASREFVVEARASPIPVSGTAAAGPRPVGTLLVVRDVSERKRLEAETSRQREVLARQEKLSELGTLVAGVAHEINNPLAYMRTLTELTQADLEQVREKPETMILEPEYADRFAEALKTIMEGIDRIHGITKSLKTVARQGTGERVPEDVNAVVGDAVALLRVGLPKSIRLDVSLDALTPKVLANASEIHQVVFNLAKNAAEALGGGPEARIAIRTRAENNVAIVEVEDNGPGIPWDVQRHLFTPFYTTKKTGTGLGLSITRGIVEAHGGEILYLESDWGGARFLVRFPALGCPPLVILPKETPVPVRL